MVISQAFPLGLEIGKADVGMALSGHVDVRCPPPAQTCSLSSCTLLLSQVVSTRRSPVFSASPRSAGTPVPETSSLFSRRASCHEGAGQLSPWGPWNLAGRPFLSSHQDISEVTLNLENESLKPSFMSSTWNLRQLGKTLNEFF